MVIDVSVFLFGFEFLKFLFRHGGPATHFSGGPDENPGREQNQKR